MEKNTPLKSLEVTKTIKQMLPIHNSLDKASLITDLHGDVNFFIASNLLETRPVFKEYVDKNNVIINSYGKKNEKGKVIFLENNQCLWENEEAETTALEKYDDLMSEELSFKIHPIKRSKETDKLPGKIMADLMEAGLIVK